MKKSDNRRNPCSLSSVAVLVAALFFASPAFAQDYLAVDEKTTTWREGDVVAYQYGCHDQEAMIAVAKAGSEELFFLYSNLDPPRCFVVSRMIPALLVKWIDGPFGDGTGEYIGSIWRIKDLGNDVEYIWLVNHTGPHKSIKAREA